MVPSQVRLLALLILAGAGCIRKVFIILSLHSRNSKAMPKNETNLQSWRIFHYARKYLGRKTLYSIFGTRHARTVDSWCEDPRFTNRESSFDPVLGIRNMLWLLDDQGHVDICRAALQMMAAGTAVDCGDHLDIIELRDTVQAEILADYRAVARMQEAIEDREHPDMILSIKQEAIAEIERTYAKYRKEYGRERQP